jgi:hypothetical protein
MKVFRKLALIALASLPVLAQAPQTELGVVRGAVVRAGSGEPVTGATLTLSVEPPASLVESMKSLAVIHGIACRRSARRSCTNAECHPGIYC